jgi:hypothetical protein
VPRPAACATRAGAGTGRHHRRRAEALVGGGSCSWQPTRRNPDTLVKRIENVGVRSAKASSTNAEPGRTTLVAAPVAARKIRHQTATMCRPPEPAGPGGQAEEGSQQEGGSSTQRHLPREVANGRLGGVAATRPCWWRGHARAGVRQGRSGTGRRLVGGRHT